MSSAENERQYRVVDQMISMHASLGQRYCRRALYLDVALLLASALLCSLTFAPDNLFGFLGLSEKIAKLILGGAGALIFALSVVQLRVNWGHVGERHNEAVGRLSSLKGKYRACFALPAEKRGPAEDALSDEYARVMEVLPPIPSKWFAKLKAEHIFKKQLSKELNNCPMSPVWLLRLTLRWRGVRAAFKCGRIESGQHD